jgi:hypothetical protein
MSIYNKTMETLPHNHRIMMQGGCFLASRSTVTIGASSWIDLQLTPTSTSKTFHLESIFVNHSPGICKIEILEANGSSMTSGTSSVSYLNKNRESTAAGNLTLYSDPTDISSSNVAVRTIIAGSTGLRIVSGSQLFCEKDGILLDPDSTYIVRLTDLTATSGYSFFEIQVCEE